ncbi:hypothetical protein [Methylobacterium oxalidis]|uniref:Uncharacterized protein n=1 Tax=Methylobacterium oxalidis TaxID=944322 RepID=A0A512J336_9HYPH|nr:hypothetical protein [Methylobacterium oxalidis]GEP04366.1 hypothetical protein MOX02_24040 [Methylobacterium oxalidis]GJE30564.1 hypothetical protein LDDCCGHA_0733 [Methylobacterium oxalidis]GLS67115.1 hypothetical protein GCM10007888_54980 [Methylobacterium oxalidis]
MTDQRDAALQDVWNASRIGSGSDLRDTLTWALLAATAALAITWDSTLTQAVMKLLAL